MTTSNNSFENVYKIVEKIPKGKVMTYGQIAKLAHLNPRVVGFALHANKDPRTIPCHRVINKQGKLAKGYAFGGAKIQKKKLEKEGIRFIKENTIDLEKYVFTF